MTFGDKEVIIIAIDFDGTITKENLWPEIGEIDHRVVEAIKKAQTLGVKFVLWTNREDSNSKYPGCLTRALDLCREHGIVFDSVNENLPIVGEYYDLDVRKISADYYIDDKSPGSIDWFLDTYGDRTNSQTIYFPLRSVRPMHGDIPNVGISFSIWNHGVRVHNHDVICIQLDNVSAFRKSYGKIEYMEVLPEATRYKSFDFYDYELSVAVTGTPDDHARIDIISIKK